MTTFRSQQIVDIIKEADSPYPYIKYFTEEQIATQRLYPSVEVQNVKPEIDSVEKDVTEVTNRFQVIIYDRYGSDRSSGTENLRTLEQNILGLLTAATLDADQDLLVGQVVLEKRDFTRTAIKFNPKKVNGIQSTLVFEIVETQATETGVPLGGQNTITIGTIVDAQVYDKPKEREEDNVEGVHNAANVRTKTFPIDEDHQFFFEIGYTDVRATELRSLKRARASITAVFKRNGIPENKTGYLTVVENGAPFRSVETLDVMMEIIN